MKSIRYGLCGLRGAGWTMIPRALQEQRVVLGVSGGWDHYGLAGGTRVGHLAYVAYQQAHPLVGLQELDSLVVSRLLEALSVHLDDLIAHLRTDSKKTSPIRSSLTKITNFRTVQKNYKKQKTLKME